MNRRPRRGFSVPEILTAIGVIMVGGVVVLHTCSHARETARTSVCASNVRQIALALRAYAEDADGAMPPGARPMAALMPYVKNEQIFCCPVRYTRRWQQRPDEEDAEAAPAIAARPNDYLCNPRAHLDDLPGTLLVADDAPRRHQGRWTGARLDTAVFLWPARQWETHWGAVRSDDKAR